MTLRNYVCALLVLIPVLALSAQQKYALLIGNGAYTNVTRLNNPVNDANDMTDALRSLGFQVDLLLNASLEQMEDAAIRLKNRLSTNVNAYGFFFYAGHGVQSNGENYLIPANADIKAESFLRTKALHIQAVMDELNQAGNALNIVVLDARRDNPFSGSRGLLVVNVQPADSIIVYATGAGKTATDGTGRNGVFTGQLLKNLKTPGLEVSELFRRTSEDVSQVSNREQIPAVYNQFFGTAYLGGSGVQPTPVVPPDRPIPANMVRIAGGTFTMGSPTSEVNRESNETQHSVTISKPFYIGKYEVTQKEWVEVMGTNPSYFKGDKLPVENVSWYDAIEYCNRRSEREGLTPAYTIDKTRRDGNNGSNYDNVKWVVTWNRNADGYRLPTEAEWELACRAGTSTPFYTGNNITTNQANYHGNYPYNNNAKGVYRGQTWAVGSGTPNNWGLYDMHGNVWEWCWDWYGLYSSGSQTDPSGAGTGSDRVRRGGAWHNDARHLRSAYRSIDFLSLRHAGLGFRLACS